MRGVEWPFTVGTSSLQVLGPNPKRKALTFSGDGTNIFTISSDGIAVIGQGITVNPTNTVETISEREIGSRIQGPWWAIANNAGSKLTIFESFD